MITRKVVLFNWSTLFIFCYPHRWCWFWVLVSLVHM